MRQSSLACLTALLVGTAPLHAQDGQTPTAVASGFLDAVTAMQWRTVIRLTDHDSLWEYVTRKRQQVREMLTAPPHPTPTVESYMRDDPSLPRAVAEYFVAQSTRYAANVPAPSLLFAIADVESLSQLDSLPDDEVYIRLLRARQVDYQFAAAARVTGCPLDSMDRAALPKVSRAVRGVALLSETEAVALYDETGFEMPPELQQFSQLHMRRTSGGWRVVASEAVLGPMHGGMAVGMDGCGKSKEPR